MVYFGVDVQLSDFSRYNWNLIIRLYTSYGCIINLE